MERTELIELVLRPHRVHLTLVSPWDRTDLTVEVPDLRDAPRRVWGDWGPMYTITMPQDRAVELVAMTGARQHPTRESVVVEKLSIQSPFLAKVRARTPLFLELILSARRARLRIFYDPLGRPKRAELAAIDRAHGEPYSIEVHPGEHGASLAPVDLESGGGLMTTIASGE